MAFKGVLFEVLEIVWKIFRQKKCPDDQELRKAVLFQNKRDSPDRDRIIAHLGICEKCRDKIHELNNSK